VAPPELTREVEPGRPKRLVEVELIGRRFRLRSDDSDEYIGELVEYLNERLLEVRRASNAVETEQVALLTLLDVADALFRERREAALLRATVGERSRALLGMIDRLSMSLGADAAGLVEVLAPVDGAETR
jgi:cell division protein ZapA (FtsZ GTPase activity inhibitor)